MRLVRKYKFLNHWLIPKIQNYKTLTKSTYFFTLKIKKSKTDGNIINRHYLKLFVFFK